MWTLQTADGRQARWCADDPSGLDEMVAELYGPDVEVTVTPPPEHRAGEVS